MSLLDKFHAMTHKKIKPRGNDTDPDEQDEQLTAEEKRELEWTRRENMRRDLLGQGWGGLHRDSRLD